MKRREFIQHTACSGSLLLWPPERLFPGSSRHIGIQLYSVRDAVEKNVAGTLEHLAEIGYTHLEGYIYENGLFHSYPPAEFKKLLSGMGLKLNSMHHGINMRHWDTTHKRLSGMAQKVVDDHAAMGVELLVSPSLDESFRTPDSLKRLCDVYNHLGEACKKAGLRFGHHNHDYEFTLHQGKPLMDTLLQHTDPDLVCWEMDLYWVVYGYADPLRWLERYPGRILAFHVKDLASGKDRITAAVGEGEIDFNAIFKHRASRGVKYYFVELEHYTLSPLEDVGRSLKNLKALGS